MQIINAQKTELGSRQRKHQKVLDKIRYEAARMDLPMGNRVILITKDEAQKLLFEMIEIGTDDKEELERMSLAWTRNDGAGYWEGKQIWGATIKIRRIHLVN